MNVRDKRILLFGGTTEGREIACFLEKNEIVSFVSVASGYGKEVLPDMKFCRVLTGRMDAGEMERFMEEQKIDLVVDATHPYAVEVSENIREAVKNRLAAISLFYPIGNCDAISLSYVRIVRKADERIADGKYFKDTNGLIEYLNAAKDGNILVTTGSKELGAFCGIAGFRDRVFARVLPVEEAVLSCRELGFPREHIITGKGPFSAEENEACLRGVGAKYLVTKDTGKQGGFWEKASAARNVGAEILILERPADEAGMTVEEFLYED